MFEIPGDAGLSVATYGVEEGSRLAEKFSLVAQSAGAADPSA